MQRFAHGAVAVGTAEDDAQTRRLLLQALRQRQRRKGLREGRCEPQHSGLRSQNLLGALVEKTGDERAGTLGLFEYTMLRLVPGDEIPIGVVARAVYMTLGRGCKDPFAQAQARCLADVVVLFQTQAVGLRAHRQILEEAEVQRHRRARYARPVQQAFQNAELNRWVGDTRPGHGD